MNDAIGSASKSASVTAEQFKAAMSNEELFDEANLESYRDALVNEQAFSDKAAVDTFIEKVNEAN